MPPIQLAPRTLWLLAVTTATLIACVAAVNTWPLTFGKDHMNDFDVFHMVSGLIGAGALGTAYDATAFVALQKTLPFNQGGPMFWSYPPPFNLVVAPLALLPVGASYAAFMGATLAFYLWALRRLAGPRFHTLLLVMAPLMGLIISSGQNSFLTGGLLGLSCVLLLEGRRSGGVALGLMIVKPHLALGLGLTLLLRRAWWAAAALAVLTAALACLAATLAFGPESWVQFRHGIASTGELLVGGVFLGFRMTSAYSFLATLGVPSGTAMAVQLVLAALAVAALVALSLRERDPRALLGFGLAAGAAFSPYIYDYDLMMLGIAAAVLAGPLGERARPREAAALALGLFVVGVYGLVANVLVTMVPGALPNVDGKPIALITPVLVAMGLLLLRILRRQVASAPGPALAPA